MNRRITKLLAPLLCLCLACAGCAAPQAAGEEKLTIVATLFPCYDFARVLAGEQTETIMLLTPGVESHSFDPTPAQLVQMSEADLFVYAGDAAEPWVQTLVDSLSDTARVVDLSQNIALLEVHDESEEAHHEEEGEEEGVDGHIWTDPLNAAAMCDTLCAAMCAADEANASLYQQRAQEYRDELEALDAEFADAVAHAKRTDLVFGGRYAMRYFCHRYGLTAHAAYDSCSHESDPGAQRVAELIDFIRESRVPVVYYEELADPKLARAMAEETGAALLLLHSCHNVSKDELAEGATYLTLMRQNLEALRKGLS